jgi:hypothetical protein
MSNERGKQLYFEILELLDDSRESPRNTLALVNVLGVVLTRAATPGKIESLTEDVIKALKTSVRKIREHDSSTSPPSINTYLPPEIIAVSPPPPTPPPILWGFEVSSPATHCGPEFVHDEQTARCEPGRTEDWQ